MDQKAFQTQIKLQTIDTQLWRYPGTVKLDPDSFKELQKSSHTHTIEQILHLYPLN